MLRIVNYVLYIAQLSTDVYMYILCIFVKCSAQKKHLIHLTCTVANKGQNTIQLMHVVGTKKKHIQLQVWKQCKFKNTNVNKI